MIPNLARMIRSLLHSKRNVFGIWDVEVTVLKLLNHALDNRNTIDESEWFDYRDYNFYFTEVCTSTIKFVVP